MIKSILGGIYALSAISVLSAVFGVLDNDDASGIGTVSGVCISLCMISILRDLMVFAG